MRDSGSGYRNAVLRDDFEYYSYETAPPDVGLHEHDFCELLLFLNGDLVYSISGESRRLHPGDLLIIAPHTLHQPFFQSARCYRRLVVWIRSSFLRDLSSSRSNLAACFEGPHRFLSLSADERAEFARLAERLAPDEGFGDDIIAGCAVSELLVLVNRAVLARGQANTVGPQRRFQEAIAMMRERYRQSLSLDDLASACFLSKYHFARSFRLEYGLTAHDYLTKIRLSEAKKLFRSGKRLNEIAELCGFVDYNSFYAAFRREYGASPRDFARMATGPRESA